MALYWSTDLLGRMALTGLLGPTGPYWAILLYCRALGPTLARPAKNIILKTGRPALPARAGRPVLII